MSDAASVADRAMEHLWRLPWAGDEERLLLTELLIHHDVPDLVMHLRALCAAVEDAR